MQIESLNLVPDRGGCFELFLNGDLAYSKLRTGEFPDEAQIVGMIGKQLKRRL
jgi:selT/selW/selH-like putative selenoprotein